MIKERIELKLSQEEAFVFFDWLANHNESKPEMENNASLVVLNNIESMLESTLVAPLQENYLSQLEEAKQLILAKSNN